MLRARLFFISYVPLLWILAVRQWPSNAKSFSEWIPCLAFVTISALAVIDAVNLTRAPSRSSDVQRNVANISDEGVNAAAYLVTYLVPFIATSLATWSDWVSNAIYFAVLFVVFVRSNFGLVNPTLYILGWRVFQADVIVTGTFGGATERATFIARTIPGPGKVTLKKMTGGYRLER